ncbi:hypothetical protein BKA64DRAFT_639379 [Cadophora sp. MPI-SDFR-AT-0126]|nr:hypothetical protein BKA64DRAFT_639379 [Leotiomycetes sp. MPI-SDFR-AT-0126]
MLLLNVLALVLRCLSSLLPADVAVSRTAGRHVLHGRQNIPPTGWMKRSGVTIEVVISLRIALKRPYLHDLRIHLFPHQYLVQRSQQALEPASGPVAGLGTPN